MASAGSAIVVSPYSLADAAAFAEFDCGSGRWAIKAAEWIKGFGVVRSLQRGNEVLVYRNVSGELVGFASIGKNKWIIDDAPVDLSYLAMFAISARFQGLRAPDGRKFSTLVLEDVIERAKHYNLGLLGLHCHPDNEPAKQLYLRFGFIILKTTDRHGNLLMVRNL